MMASDEELMLAYARGDSAAFETLYHRHREPLYRFFIRQIGERNLAEDLYQECWGRVIRAASDYEVKSKFTTWIYRIAHNLITDHYRAFKPHTPAGEPPDLNEAILDVSNPEKAMSNQHLAVKLKDCLNRLPAVQLEVFVLSNESDMTLREIAEVVGASFESVKTRFRYAKDKLKECLEAFASRVNNVGGEGRE